MDFEFIQDQRFKELLARDYQELTICFENKSSKAVLILAGSIVEAILVEYFLQNLPTGKSDNDILRMTLGTLIDIAEKAKLLTTKEKNLASVIQDYRNLIHPGRQIRESEKYDFETASIAKTLVKIITDAIRLKQQATNPLTANEIIEKLKNDWNFRSIYDKVIFKLNQVDRNRLIDLFIKYEIIALEQGGFLGAQRPFSPNYTDYIDDIKPLVIGLKPLLQPEVIIVKLNDLMTEIQRGEKLKAFALFNFFHEDIDKLSSEEQEIIAIYFLSSFSDLLENCDFLVYDKTYSTIGKYIKTDSGITEFKSFTVFCIVHFTKKGIERNREMDFYEQAFNSLKDEDKIVVRDYISDFLFGDNRIPPKEVLEAFVNEAFKRGIISRKDEDLKL